MRLPWEAKSKAVLQKAATLLLSSVLCFSPHVLANVLSKYFFCSFLVTSCVISIVFYTLAFLILSL